MRSEPIAARIGRRARLCSNANRPCPDVLPIPNTRIAEVGSVARISYASWRPAAAGRHADRRVAIWRAEVAPFTDKQIELVETFADQAVIAIENTRLFDEVQAAHRELTESLEQQTATSEVLQGHLSSPGDLEPVFETMLANRRRDFARPTFGTRFTSRRGRLPRSATARIAAAHYAEARRREPLIRSQPGDPSQARVVRRSRCNIADMPDDAGRCRRRRPVIDCQSSCGRRAPARRPMLKEDELVGAIAIYRQEVRPFTDKQIELVTNFADQAVIAIENTRLLNELRESACSSRPPLPTCSRSSAARLSICRRCCKPSWNQRLVSAMPTRRRITREKDGVFYRAEAYGFSASFMDYVKDIPIKAERGSASGRALLEGRVVHIADVAG